MILFAELAELVQYAPLITAFPHILEFFYLKFKALKVFEKQDRCLKVLEFTIYQVRLRDINNFVKECFV